MKKLILIMAATLQSVLVLSQINLEHTYDSTTCSEHNGLFKVQLDLAGSKYVAVNASTQQMTLYNLDHTIYKVINLTVYNSQDLILFISDQLFNLDNKIEFIQLGGGGASQWIRIYNEDGILLWQENDCPGCGLMYHTAGFMSPVVNTDSGTKLIVTVFTSVSYVYKFKVYSLPGTLTSTGLELYDNQVPEAMKIYPNPSSAELVIEFELPKGKKEGEIVIYNLEGVEIKRIAVNGSDKKVVVDNSSLSSGTYLYRLVAEGYSNSRKIIVVR